MKKTKTFLICAILLCALQPTLAQRWIAERGMEQDPMTFRKQTATGGIITGSVTFPDIKARFDGYFFKVSCVSGDEKFRRKNTREFSLKPDVVFSHKHQGESDGGLTYLFAIERPEGEYVINLLRLSTLGFGHSTDDFVTNFEIRFTVKKGEITYVGNIKVNEHPVAGKKLLELGNTFDKDLVVLQQLQPAVYWKGAIQDPDRKIVYTAAQ